MKRIVVKYRFSFSRASFWLALVGICLSSLSLMAGEKIVFGNEKSKVNPDKKSPLSKETAKVWGKLDTDPLDDSLLFNRSRNEVFDPKKEKERKLKRLEEMNWMFINPGELTDEDEDKLAGREEDPSMALDKKDDKELMFRGLLDKKSTGSLSSSKNLGQSGKKDKNPQPRSSAKSSDGEDLSPGSRSLFPGKAETKSTHTEEASNFKKLFEPSSSSSAASDKSDGSMGSLFQRGTVSVLTQAQKASREEYRSFINGPQSLRSVGTASPSELSKLGSGSANPLLPKASDTIARTPGLDTYGGGISRSGAAMDAQSGWGYGGVSGYGTLQPANIAPRTTPLQPSQGFEPTRARGMGSLGGH
jgi:hypothetical protein